MKGFIYGALVTALVIAAALGVSTFLVTSGTLPAANAVEKNDGLYKGEIQRVQRAGGDPYLNRIYDSELDVYCWTYRANQGGVSCLPRNFIEQYKAMNKEFAGNPASN